jgi:hypothetical protein
MKKIGDILSAILGEEARERLTEYTNLDDAWQSVLLEAFSENAVTGQRTSEHTRVARIEKNILFIKTDHQGWAQILQTKQKKILGIIQKRYPEMTLNSIAFYLTAPQPL